MMELIAVSLEWTSGGVKIRAMIKCPTCDTILVRPISMIHDTERCRECFAMVRSLVKVRGSKLHCIWRGMKSRCHNPNRPVWPRYGGRGISICEEWRENFHAFKAWAMANGFRRGLTIDRRDNDRGYSPDNCRWIPQPDQMRNASTNRVTVEEALEIRALLAEGMRGADIARRYGISKTVVSRIKTRRSWNI